MLSADGHRVAVSGRDRERLGSLAEELGALAIPADATDFDEVDAVVRAVVDRFGQIDGVANCIGSLLRKPAHLTREREWGDALRTNLTSAFAVVRSAVPPMMEQGHGSLVLISASAASIGLPNHDATAAAAGGIDALVRSAAATYGRAGIRVNAVAPGLADPVRMDRITRSESPLSSSLAKHAVHGLDRGENVAAAMRWLLSADAPWTTGQTIGVDVDARGAPAPRRTP